MAAFHALAVRAIQKTGAALRDIGRDYLMKATKVSSAFEIKPPQIRWPRRDDRMG
jgi:hypothetical protein